MKRAPPSGSALFFYDWVFHDCAVNKRPFGKTSGQEKAQMKMKKLFLLQKLVKNLSAHKILQIDYNFVENFLHEGDILGMYRKGKRTFRRLNVRRDTSSEREMFPKGGSFAKNYPSQMR